MTARPMPLGQRTVAFDCIERLLAPYARVADEQERSRGRRKSNSNKAHKQRSKRESGQIARTAAHQLTKKQRRNGLTTTE